MLVYHPTAQPCFGSSSEMELSINRPAIVAPLQIQLYLHTKITVVPAGDGHSHFYRRHVIIITAHVTMLL